MTSAGVICLLALLLAWAVALVVTQRSSGEDGADDEDGGRGNQPRPRAPRPRGPHGERAVPSPPRVRAPSRATRGRSAAK